MGSWLKGQWETCIAIRTMLTKDNGAVYLPAGGGIVHESDEMEV
jgi:anthranilate/para-aminobenzoate synthase component I